MHCILDLYSTQSAKKGKVSKQSSSKACSSQACITGASATEACIGEAGFTETYMLSLKQQNLLTEKCLQSLQLKAANRLKKKKKAKTAREKARLARPQTRSQDAGRPALPIRQGERNNLCGCCHCMHNIFTCCTLAACVA